MGIDVGRRSIVEWAENAPEEGGQEFVPARDRFVLEAPIGEGGMGEVFLVADKDLRRQVAMKVLREEAAKSRAHRLHFVAEAQTTSQLDHPGIPPVHDIGINEGGRPYFTMKLVRGRTIGEVIHDLLLRRRDVQKEYTLHRLVTILERVAETLHFAHERGVIHRDLKPENVMLGDYGEVHVIDWGLARVEGESDELLDLAEEAEVDRVETARTEAGLHTQHGTIKGTVPYMSPEQLRGEAHLDRRSDLYALGCLLYEVLALQPAFQPGDPDLLRKKLSGEVVDVQERTPRRRVPDVLAEVCRKAMQAERAARFENASEIATALRDWLDGTSERVRRHHEAERLAKEGEAAVIAYGRAKESLEAARGAAEKEAAEVKPWQPLAEKRTLLDARRALKDAERTVALAFAETLRPLEAALLQEERNERARAALSDLWRTRLEEAEAEGSDANRAYALTMLERHDDGRLARVIEGTGTLVLRSEPAGARVTLSRFVDEDGVLRAEGERDLGPAPIETDLPMGSYLCVLSKEGFPEVRYPVSIARNARWEGAVRMRSEEELGDGFVYVPGGPFLYGEGRARKTVELQDFVIQRYPVTMQEYGAFLDALPDGKVEERVPGTVGDGAFFVRGEDGRWGPKPDLIDEEPQASRYRRDYGEDWLWRLPVFGVSWHDAVAYCTWKTETTGEAWRLPTEEEREKATRGVDGRLFPWGNLEDASLGKCQSSREEKPQPEPVGTFPTAASVYGMGDAAGNVWDWTDSWFDEIQGLRVLRGGAWYDAPTVMRSAIRDRLDPVGRFASVGFRCARGLRAL